jgi:hypothetical protein
MESSITLREVLLCEENDCVPEGIDPQMCKDADDGDPAPTYDELEDGTLQFYNGESGRPCRNLCEFEKDLLKDFWCQSMSMPPSELLSFKDLEIWRQMLNTPGLDAWETYVKTHQTPRQKEEREDSIKEWRSMMHDRFWHKQHGCQCKSNRHPERFAVEETIEDVIMSLIKTQRKNTSKKGKIPVKKECVDESITTPPERAQRENRSVKTKSTSTRKSTKKNTANETATNKRKAATKPDETPDMTAVEENPSKKRKSAAKAIKIPKTIAELTEMITKDLDKPSARAKLDEDLQEMGHEAKLNDLKAMGYELKSEQDVTPVKKEKASALKTPNKAVATSNQDTNDAPVNTPGTSAHKAPKKTAATPKSSETVETSRMSATASEETVADGTPRKEFKLKLKINLASKIIDEQDEEMSAPVKKPRTRVPARKTPKKTVVTPKDAETAKNNDISAMDDTPSKHLNLGAMKIEEDVEEMMDASVKTPKTPIKRKTSVKKNTGTPKQAETLNMSAKTPIETATEDTPSKQLDIASMTIAEREDEEMVDAPAENPTTPAKRKSLATKNAATATPVKKLKTPVKKQPTTPETPTKKGKTAEKDVIKVEKSDDIILF